MIMKENKQIGFIYKNNESIDKIIQNGEVVFERGFLREKTSTTLPITFGGVGKDLKDYRVYGNTYQKTTLGINKLENKIKAGRYASGITFTYNEDGTYTFSGQNTTNSNATVALFQNDSFFLPKGTYYYIPTGNSNVTITLQYLDGATTRYLDMSTSGSFTINSDITFRSCYAQVRKKTATVFENYKVYPMLSATPITIDDYEPYTNGASPNPDYPQEIISCGDLITDTNDVNYGKYKIPVNVNNVITNIYLDEPLRKSNDGTYKDYIDFKNQKIYRQIKETVLTGNENWGRIGANNNGNRFRTAISDLAIGAEKILHCTHFKNDGDTWSHQGISGSLGTMLYIRWDELFETVEDLKTWLASNTPIVDYVLATPTEESITLPNIPTIDGNNTLNIETEITPSQVYIKYKSNT